MILPRHQQNPLTACVVLPVEALLRHYGYRRLYETRP